MKWWLIFPVILLVFLQTTLVNFNFLLFFILLLAFSGKEKEALVFAFFGGLFLDLLAGTRLGLGSLTCLLAAGIVIVYSRKFEVKNLFFWLAIFLLSSFLFKWLRGEVWHWQEGLMMAISGSVIFFLLEKLGVLGEEEGIRLKI